MKNLAKLLTQAQKKKKLKDVEVAGALDISPQFWGRVKKGLSPFPKSWIEEVAELFKIHKSEIKRCLVRDYQEDLEDV